MKTLRSNFSLEIYQTDSGWAGKSSGCSGKGTFSFSAEGKDVNEVFEKLESAWPGNDFYHAELGALSTGCCEESCAQGDPGDAAAGA